jgi:RNA ligase (TIGR02306 family)
MRKLASIRKIADIRPIPDADAIEVAVVDGWKVVVKKGEYSVGDLAVYLEIDSWVPTELAPFLSKGQEPREYNGVKGERLRTVKLRGQVSQGLLLPLRPFFADWTDENFQKNILEDEERVGDDLTEALGIQKWEPVLPAQLQGQVRGMFPTNLIPKTDQERIQNCFQEIQDKGDVTYEVTMKLDGTSCTIFRWEGELRVCSRNLELKVNEENKDNTLVAMALKIGDSIPDGFAFQGELMGPGIQGNRESFKDHKFFVFDVFNMFTNLYVSPIARREVCKQLNLEHVPVLYQVSAAPESVDAGLAIAEGPSINHKIREGLVWKCNEDPGFSFKTISNQFLLKGGD